MDREILFRGKRVDNGGWVEGLLTVMFGQYHIINPINENIAYPIVSETACQYTGLTDKNGRKIFEGDIVKLHFLYTENVCKVIFRDGMFMGELADGGEDSIIAAEEVCIIGNIFDNPSLLEGGES